jgi:hypothetical protein
LDLEISISNISKRLDRFDSLMVPSNKTGLSTWKGRQIIPLDKWIELRNTSCTLDYFPDDFDQVLTYLPKDEVGREREDVRKWDSDFLELMEYTKNPNYDRLKCFHCLIKPSWR